MQTLESCHFFVSDGASRSSESELSAFQKLDWLVCTEEEAERDELMMTQFIQHILTTKEDEKSPCYCFNCIHVHDMW